MKLISQYHSSQIYSDASHWGLRTCRQAVFFPTRTAWYGVALTFNGPLAPGLACLFCREQKIACGGPPEGSADLTCNQCARRSLNCEWPVMSRRGLHRCCDNGDSHPDYEPTNP
ncbi:hypothetical protein EI94DRAFT_1731655 [Lactarius quietus]|nr:hypothetical protein EI94DRAFT_1731655 [Lactarius quietus]